MSRIHGRIFLALLIPAVSMGTGGGCPPGGVNPPPNFTPLAGVWSITRGTIRVTLAWTGGSSGQIQSDSNTGELLPVNVSEFPSFLQPLAQQWNNGLAQLNASLDAAIPPEVVITFPTFLGMRIQNAAEPAKVINGVINVNDQYLFAGDVSGGGEGSDQGGGAVLSLASIDGAFNRSALTTSGKLARTLIVALIGQQGGVVITAQISVDFTGTRTGDVPTSQPAP